MKYTREQVVEWSKEGEPAPSVLAWNTDMNVDERLCELIEYFDGSTSLQVGAVMDLMTDDNVDRLIKAMPVEFRMTFMDWVSRMGHGDLLPGAGEIARRGHAAVRKWFAGQR